MLDVEIRVRNRIGVLNLRTVRQVDGDDVTPDRADESVRRALDELVRCLRDGPPTVVHMDCPDSCDAENDASSPDDLASASGDLQTMFRFLGRFERHSRHLTPHDREAMLAVVRPSLEALLR